MKWGFLLAVIFSSAICNAQSLRDMAVAEAKYDGLAKQSATDAQVSGMLTLKDPRPEIITRSWKYFAGFSVQSFQPEGIATKDGSGSFDMSENGTTVMPGLELGVMSPALQTKALLWKLGLRAKGGFASQSANVKLDSGYEIDDARLNTIMFSAGPVVSLGWERLPWLSLNVSPQFGNISYTQSSSNDFATFSKSGAYESMNYGVDVMLGKKWSVFTEWSQRTLKDNNEIALQKDNFELGTKVTW
ncbi:hypothetical protein ACES2I_04580 [Bdellovibrio bacteriovorus]|uniref:hypothetical protein n=1 Tax=Bdellovibrio bacteriovorus TaxID=959 RepID=UPI0035A65705